jgi:hypothetical protein
MGAYNATTNSSTKNSNLQEHHRGASPRIQACWAHVDIKEDHHLRSSPSHPNVAIWLPLISKNSTRPSGEGSPEGGKTTKGEQGDLRPWKLPLQAPSARPLEEGSPKEGRPAAREQRQPQTRTKNLLTRLQIRERNTGTRQPDTKNFPLLDVTRPHQASCA